MFKTRQPVLFYLMENALFMTYREVNMVSIDLLSDKLFWIAQRQNMGTEIKTAVVSKVQGQIKAA